jgi:hypothetical protein
VKRASRTPAARALQERWRDGSQALIDIAFRARPKHRQRSFAIAFSADCLCWLRRRVHSLAPLQTGSQFMKRRPLGHMTKLAEQIVGERHARQCRTRLEPTMQRIRYIANLDRPGHLCRRSARVHYMSTCSRLAATKLIRIQSPWHGPEIKDQGDPSHIHRFEPLLSSQHPSAIRRQQRGSRQ